MGWWAGTWLNPFSAVEMEPRSRPTRALASALFLVAAAAQNEADEAATTTRMRIQILPEAGESSETAQVLLNRLKDRIADGPGGVSGADEFSMLRDIQPETLTAQLTRDAGHAAVDVYSESAFNAVANDDFRVTAGGFTGRIQDHAQLLTGGLEVQSLEKVSLSSGDDVQTSVDGNIGTAAAGSISLDAAALDSRVRGHIGLSSGSGVSVASGGTASLDAGTLVANVHGGIDASGAAINLAGANKLSVVAGDLDVLTPGSARLAAAGAIAEIDGAAKMEFVSFRWFSDSTFDTWQNVLPEEMGEVVEVIIRATVPGSAAQVVVAAHTVLTIDIGEHVTSDGGTGLSYTTVWQSSIGQGTYSLDGLVVRLGRQFSVAALRLSSSAGDGNTYSGWSEVKVLLGHEEAGGTVRVASASNLEATARNGVLLNAQTVQLNAAAELEVSASSVARLLSNSVSVRASDSLEATAGSLDVQVSDRIDVFGGGDLSGSFDDVAAEARGEASLAAAGGVSVAGQSADVMLSGPLSAATTELKVRTRDQASLRSATLSAVATESASLHTTDASLSLAGQMSAFMDEANIFAENGVSVQTQGGMDLRGDSLSMAALTTSLVSHDVSAMVGSLQVRAQSQGKSVRVRMPVDCEGAEGGCDGAAMQEELAELLGVPTARLRLRLGGKAS